MTDNKIQAIKKAEEHLLASILKKPDLLLEVDLVAENFYSNKHKTIFRAMQNIDNKNEVIELPNLYKHLDKIKASELTSIAKASNLIASPLESVLQNSKIIKEYSKTENLKKALYKAEKILENDNLTIDEKTSQIENEMFDFSNNCNFEKNNKKIMSSDWINLIEDLGKKDKSIKTEWEDFNETLNGGLKENDLYVVGGRPGMGKTAFSMNIADHIALKENKSVLIFSLEMKKDKLMKRMASRNSAIDFSKLDNTNKFNRLRDDEHLELNTTLDELSEADIIINDNNLTIEEIRRHGRKAKKKHNIGLVVIDYIERIEGLNNTEERHDLKLERYIKNCKSMARELEIPVIVLSQLNRGVESRNNKRPVLSDLKNSSALEQEADVVILLYREAYYDDDLKKTIEKVEVIFGKNRHGKTGTINLGFKGNNYKFLEITY